MKVFTIFDETGRLYGIEYGEKQILPKQINFLQSEIPDGAHITGIEINDGEPQIIYTEPKNANLK